MEAPQRLWEAKLCEYEAKATPITFELFSESMMKFYDTLIPARKFRQEFKSLTQTGTVSHFVREMKRVVHELSDTPMYVVPSDVIEKFIDGLKPAAKKYVEDMAPPGWWTESEALFDKALNYEMNINASTSRGDTGQINAMAMGAYPQAQPRPQRGNGRQRYNPRFQPSGRPQAQRFQPPNPGNPRIDRALWQQRIQAGACGYCARKNHSSWECTDRHHDSRIASRAPNGNARRF